VHAEVLDTYRVHKAIHDEVITIEMISKTIDNSPLKNFAHPETSRLGQLICSGLLKLFDLISRESFPKNSFF
jgi:hypothetical protein